MLASFLAMLAGSLGAHAAQTVHFRSADGQTELVGYLFTPTERGRHPAVVMLHGRGGPYSSLAKGVYTVDTLSKRHKFWGEHWAARGYVALLVDSFGPRGHWRGFPKASYEDRPSDVSEQTVRPLDAYGALAFLAARSDVLPDRVGLQGWSNGGMTALVTMSTRAPGRRARVAGAQFEAALVFYPGCGMEAIQESVLLALRADPDVRRHRGHGSVGPALHVVEKRVQAGGGAIDLVAYEGAEHDFDQPECAPAARGANAVATQDAIRRADAFFTAQLR